MFYTILIEKESINTLIVIPFDVIKGLIAWKLTNATLCSAKGLLHPHFPGLNIQLMAPQEPSKKHLPAAVSHLNHYKCIKCRNNYGRNLCNILYDKQFWGTKLTYCKISEIPENYFVQKVDAFIVFWFISCCPSGRLICSYKLEHCSPI
jgi:hypothetical protein